MSTSQAGVSSSAVDGIVTMKFYVDGELAGKDTMLVTDGKEVTSLYATVPLRVGLLGGGAEIKVEMTFDPPMRPRPRASG